MKWFKHYTNASDDEEIDALISEFGGDGYMYYWRVLETIAKQMEPDSVKTYLEYSWKKWADSCGLSQQKFKKISNFVETFSLFFLKKSSKSLKIDCPKLLKIKDEYSKKSGQKTDKLPPKNKESESDKDSTPLSPTDQQAFERIHSRLFNGAGDFSRQLAEAISIYPLSQIENGVNAFLETGKRNVGWKYIEGCIKNAPLAVAENAADNEADRKAREIEARIQASPPEPSFQEQLEAYRKKLENEQKEGQEATCE